MISNYVFTLVQNCAEYIFGGLDRFTNFFGQKWESKIIIWFTSVIAFILQNILTVTEFSSI